MPCSKSSSTAWIARPSKPRCALASTARVVRASSRYRGQLRRQARQASFPPPSAAVLRILAHGFATGGGFAGPEVPAALAREGAAMRDALIADLAALGGHSIVTTMDPRFPMAARPHMDVVPVRPGTPLSKTLIRSADAVWLIAPETAGCLERLARRVERCGTMLLGSGATAIRRAADKQRLARRLARSGVVHP